LENKTKSSKNILIYVIIIVIVVVIIIIVIIILVISKKKKNIKVTFTENQKITELYVSPVTIVGDLIDKYLKMKKIKKTKKIVFICNGENLGDDDNKIKEVEKIVQKQSESNQLVIIVNDFSDIYSSSELTK